MAFVTARRGERVRTTRACHSHFRCRLAAFVTRPRLSAQVRSLLPSSCAFKAASLAKGIRIGLAGRRFSVDRATRAAVAAATLPILEVAPDPPPSRAGPRS